MASFPLPPNEQKMKNNHYYEEWCIYDASTKVPYKVDVSPG